MNTGAGEKDLFDLEAKRSRAWEEEHECSLLVLHLHLIWALLSSNIFAAAWSRINWLWKKSFFHWKGGTLITVMLYSVWTLMLWNEGWLAGQEEVWKVCLWNLSSHAIDMSTIYRTTVFLANVIEWLPFVPAPVWERFPVLVNQLRTSTFC